MGKENINIIIIITIIIAITINFRDIKSIFQCKYKDAYDFERKLIYSSFA
jgi:hypothetical protein